MAKGRWVKTERGWEHTDPRIQNILFQVRAGRPFRLIAQQFGVTMQRVSAIRSRAGIPRRYKPREVS